MDKIKFYIGPDGNSVLTEQDMAEDIEKYPYVKHWTGGSIEVFKADCKLIGEFYTRDEACQEACELLEINHMDYDK